MSKELEALHTIAFNTQINGLNFGDELRIIEQALQRLEAIENAKPSKALNCLEEMAKYRIEYSDYSMPIKDISEYKIIKQALQQNITWKHIHNTKVRVPLIQIFNGKTQEEKHQIIENIYYTWEEKKEALEDKNNELEQENAELKKKTQEQEKVLEIIKEKNVNIIILKLATNVNEYNERMLANGLMLTQQEFDLLKRCFNEQNH